MLLTKTDLKRKGNDNITQRKIESFTRIECWRAPCSSRAMALRAGVRRGSQVLSAPHLTPSLTRDSHLLLTNRWKASTHIKERARAVESGGFKGDQGTTALCLALLVARRGPEPKREIEGVFHFEQKKETRRKEIKNDLVNDKVSSNGSGVDFGPYPAVPKTFTCCKHVLESLRHPPHLTKCTRPN